MNNIFPTLSGEVIAAIVGLFVGAGLKYVSDRWAEKRKVAAEYRQQQIKELYGPLDSLINQTHILHEIYERMIRFDRDGNEDLPEGYIDEKTKERHPEVLQGDKKKIWEFFRDTYFLPMNKRVQELIINSHHLLSTYHPPKSFQDFLKHQAQFESRRSLEERNIETTEKQVERNPWEEQFNKDVSRTLWELKEDVEIALGLRSSLWKLIPRRFKREQRTKRPTQ